MNRLQPDMGLTLGFDYRFVPFTMTDTGVFLLLLLEVLESGLVRESSDRAQYAHDENTTKVSEAIGEHMGSHSDEQIVAYNHDSSYLY